MRCHGPEPIDQMKAPICRSFRADRNTILPGPSVLHDFVVEADIPCRMSEPLKALAIETGKTEKTVVIKTAQFVIALLFDILDRGIEPLLKRRIIMIDNKESHS